jgi:CheY-like chemotaxis protein
LLPGQRGSPDGLKPADWNVPADAAKLVPFHPDGHKPLEAPFSVSRILIVEDNVDAAESLGVLLQLTGHETSLAHTGPEALDKARTFVPEVVLCDIGLPNGMDGYAVARALRIEPATRASYLIALTGYGQEEDQVQAHRSGFDLHLTKPVDPLTLRRILSGPLTTG